MNFCECILWTKRYTLARLWAAIMFMTTMSISHSSMADQWTNINFSPASSACSVSTMSNVPCIMGNAVLSLTEGNMLTVTDSSGVEHPARWYGITVSLSGTIASTRYNGTNGGSAGNMRVDCAASGCAIAISLEGQSIYLNAGCRASGVTCDTDFVWSNYASVSSTTSPNMGAGWGAAWYISGAVSTPTWVLVVNNPAAQGSVQKYRLPGGASVSGFPDNKTLPIKVGVVTNTYNQTGQMVRPPMFIATPFSGFTVAPIVPPPVVPVVQCDFKLLSDIDLGTVDVTNALGRSATTSLNSQCTGDATVTATLRAIGGTSNVVSMGGLQVASSFEQTGTSKVQFAVSKAAQANAVISAEVTSADALIPGVYSSAMVVAITYE